MRVIAKFGGTSLGSGDRINRAADSIARTVEAGHEVAVVASAMGSTTDDLLGEIAFEAAASDRAEIVSMGERTSVRMLKAALTARGIDAMFLEPGTELWPIVTNDLGEVDVPETKARAEELAAHLETVVPVITGFLAQNHAGEVTTLGRGGSDTTAVMLGSYTDADQVVIVTDVEGVMTGDPRVVEGAQNVGRISVDELRNLSSVELRSSPPRRCRTSPMAWASGWSTYQHGDLLSGGTDIGGEFENLIDLQEEMLSCLTIAGRAIRNQPGILAELSGVLRDAAINVEAVASGIDSITFFVQDAVAKDAENRLHARVLDDRWLSSITVDDGVAVLRVTGGEFPNRPGVIAEIVNPLAEAGSTSMM